MEQAQDFTARSLLLTGNMLRGNMQISPDLLAFMSDLNHLGYHFEYHGYDTELPGVARVWRSDDDNPLDTIRKMLDLGGDK